MNYGQQPQQQYVQQPYAQHPPQPYPSPGQPQPTYSPGPQSYTATPTLQYGQPAYQPQPQMSTVGGNRNALNKPYNAAGQREWSHGLCDCCEDCSTCFASMYCPCMVHQSNKSRRLHLENHGTPHREGGENTGGDCCTFCLAQWCGFGWALNMSDRAAIRARYGIEGDSGSDCFTSWCCLPLALTQQSREIEEEERSFVQQMGQQGMITEVK